MKKIFTKVLAAALAIGMAASLPITAHAEQKTLPDGTVVDFDAAAYSERYPDLKAAFGTNADLLWNHYANYGFKEGRDASGTAAAFDPVFYANTYPDVAKALGTDASLLYQHYINFGIKEGRLPSAGGAAASSAAANAATAAKAGAKVMKVYVVQQRNDNNNIGEEWSYVNQINGENILPERAISVGETLNFYSKFTEADKFPDVGEASASHIVTAEDILSGFTIPMDLYVKENGGRNKGKTAHFTVTYIFTTK